MTRPRSGGDGLDATDLTDYSVDRACLGSGALLYATVHIVGWSFRRCRAAVHRRRSAPGGA